jgi:phosphatidylglycerol lysyltransferase
MIEKSSRKAKIPLPNNKIYLNIAAIFWTVLTLWISRTYTPSRDIDNTILLGIGILGFGTLAIVYYTHIVPYGIEALIVSTPPLDPQGKLLFFGAKVKGFIAYKLSFGFAIVIEGPVCHYDIKATLIKEFEWFCRMRGLKPCYIKAHADEVKIFSKLGKKSLQIGNEAIVNIQNFSLDEKKYTYLKTAIDRMKRDGLHTKTHLPPLKAGLIQQLEKVSDDWLKNTEKKKGSFSHQSFNTDEIKTYQIISIENHEGKIIAFMSIAPAYNSTEASYHLIRKISEAPEEILDILIIKMIEYCRACEYQYLNMGVVPSFSSLYKIPLFNSQRTIIDFKEKFGPQWRKQFLVYEHSYDLLLLPIVIYKMINM